MGVWTCLNKGKDVEHGAQLFDLFLAARSHLQLSQAVTLPWWQWDDHENLLNFCYAHHASAGIMLLKAVFKYFSAIHINISLQCFVQLLLCIKFGRPVRFGPCAIFSPFGLALFDRFPRLGQSSPGQGGSTASLALETPWVPRCENFGTRNVCVL